LGEVKNDKFLITNKAKSAYTSGSFSPHGSRGAYSKYSDYAGYAMYAGHEDFPAPEDL